MSKNDEDPSLFLGLRLESPITLQSTHLYLDLTTLVASAGSFYPPVSPNRPTSLTSSNWEMMYKDRPGLGLVGLKGFGTVAIVCDECRTSVSVFFFLRKGLFYL